MKRSRSILLLLTDLQIGGTPAVVRELACRLQRTGLARIEVACLATSGPVAGQLQAAGIKVTALGARGPFDFRVFGRLKRLIRSKNFDTVLSFLVHANVAATLARICGNKFRLLQSIQTTQPWPSWHWKLQACIHRAADAIVVPSPSVASIAHALAYVPPDKFAVIPNAVDADRFNPSFISRTRPRPFPVGFIGRFDPVKRIGDLIEAVNLLRGQVHLHLFGDGPERGRIEKQIDQLQLGDSITVHGAIGDARDALSRIGCLVLCSQAEGFGLVLIEAMAAGIPVVATNVPGIRDVVRDGLTGLLVPVAAPPALAGGIRRIVENEPLREKLIATAAQDVRRRFSWEVVLPHYLRLLQLD